jgi:hypothetical protein
MTDTAKRDYLPDSPYPGIEPFSYAARNVFFARETEARTLIRLIVMYRGVLLYSDSGTGKSSLVNAGLIPLATEEGYQPERLRVQPKRGQEIIVERLSEKADGEPPFLPSIFAPDEKEGRVDLPVDMFLKTLGQKRARAVRPLLIFDQFEEWITLFEQDSREQEPGGTRVSKERILNALVELIKDSELPVKVLIVLREDYLAKLTPLFERCPYLPDQYLRLTPLKGDQVYRAIRGPFEEHPGRYRPELSPSLAKKIQTQFEDRSGGADIRLTEVQIVCRSLFETGKHGAELEQHFTDKEGVKGILEEYLKRALELLKPDQREPAVALLTQMVTSAGTRKRISRDDLLSWVEREDEIPRELLSKTLDSLEQETKLVRRERLREVHYYEIASEFLVEWIRKKAQERQLLAEKRKAAREAAEREREIARQQELEAVRKLAKEAEARRRAEGQQAKAERQRAEAQARAAGRLRRLAVALAGVFLLAMAAAVYAGIQQQRAIYAGETAQAEAARAQQAEGIARVEAFLAQQNESIALAISTASVKQQQTAEAEQYSARATLGAVLEANLTAQASSAEATPESPTDTAIPSPTATSTGTLTPPPETTPTATPTASPTPTSNPTVEFLATELAKVRATQTLVAKVESCVEPQGDLRSFWNKHKWRLGCPTQTDPIDGYFAEQRFENGYMLWSPQKENLPEELFVVTIGSDIGTWHQFRGEDFLEFDCPDEGVSCPLDTPPPPDRFQPKRGFGCIWCAWKDIQESIGLGTEKERAVSSGILLQEFEHGIILRDSQSWVYILFEDDETTYIRERP